MYQFVAGLSFSVGNGLRLDGDEANAGYCLCFVVRPVGS